MRRPVRIANCSGFYGDRAAAAWEMVDGGPIDVLTGDYLAELTMLILWKARQKDQDAGYARTFLSQFEQVIGTCLDRGITIVTNAGGLNPAGLAGRLREIAARLGLAPKIAHIEGDDLLDRIGDLTEAGLALAHADTGEPLAKAGVTPVTANAYLGGWGIAAALRAGADVVVCPRVTDASLVVGPAAAWHGWGPADLDALAGAVAAGHVIECGPQATGGNYAFLDELPDRRYPGFPIAEVAEDGSSVITKHPGTGGLVSPGTVTAQLLYELGEPAYANPDVVAHFDTPAAVLRRSGPRPDQRHPRQPAAGRPQGRAELPRRLPQHHDHGPDRPGHRGEGGQGGDHAVRPARRPGAVRRGRRAADPHGPPGRADQRAGHRPAADHRQGPRPGQGRPFVLERHDRAGARRLRRVPHHDPADLGGRVRRVLADVRARLRGRARGRPARRQPPRHPGGQSRRRYAAGRDPARRGGERGRAGPTRRAPLGLVCGARSGDKGGNANVGLWARSPDGYGWLREYLDVARFRELLPEAADLEVRRYELPNLRALNFVVVGLLGLGVAASTRPDPQAKGLGEYLRSRHADIPLQLLPG